MIERLDHLSLSHSFQPGGEQDEERKQNYFFFFKENKTLDKRGKDSTRSQESKGVSNC